MCIIACLSLILSIAALCCAKRCGMEVQGTINKWKLLDTPPIKNLDPDRPFYCPYQLIARGGKFGDRIQLRIAHFRISGQDNRNCQHGFMQIIDGITSIRLNQRRPGYYCEHPLENDRYFYSETNEILLAFQLHNVTRSSISDFEFEVYYRFLPLSAAKGRYGSATEPANTGITTPGTYCNKIFVNCTLGKCRLQSPGWPGVYPRNLDCKYLVKIENLNNVQILLWQKDGSRINIATPDSPTKKDKSVAASLSYSCPENGDFVRIYDGNSTSAPVITTFCHSGPLPKVASTGPQILVQFRTAEYGRFDYAGFDLETEFRELTDLTGARMMSGDCNFDIYRIGNNNSGLLTSVEHWYPRNTKCSYKFHGRLKDRVWITFLDWNVDMNKRCKNSLEIYDGARARSSKRIGDRYCYDNSPYLCLHALVLGYHFRPCKIGEESYLSSTNSFLLTFTSKEGSFFGLNTFYFKLRYEFVDTEQLGRPLVGADDSCVRIIESSGLSSGLVWPPKNVLLYGPGGRSSVQCSYTFQGNKQERIRVIVNHVKLGKTSCKTHFNSSISRYECKLSKLPNNNLIISDGSNPIQTACLCENDLPHNEPLTITSTTNRLQINFSVDDMKPWQYFRDYHFEAKYEFTENYGCREQMFTASSGEFDSSTYTKALSADDIRCRWSITVNEGNYVYLNFTSLLFTHHCEDEKIIIFDADDPKPRKIICRSSVDAINDVFSKDWNSANYYSPDSNKILVEYMSKPFGGRFAARWLEIAKPSPLSSYWNNGAQGDSCGFICPGVHACINTALLCNGIADCPSARDPLTSADEEGAICGVVVEETFPWLYVGLSAGFAGLVLLICFVWFIDCVVRRWRRARPRRHRLQQQPLNTYQEYQDGQFKTIHSRNWD